MEVDSAKVAIVVDGAATTLYNQTQHVTPQSTPPPPPAYRTTDAQQRQRRAALHSACIAPRRESQRCAAYASCTAPAPVLTRQCRGVAAVVRAAPHTAARRQLPVLRQYGRVDFSIQ